MPPQGAVLALFTLLLQASSSAVAHPALSEKFPSAGEFENSNGFAELGNTHIGAAWEQGRRGDVGSQHGVEESSGGDPEHSCGSGGKGGGGGGSWGSDVTTKTITDW